VQECPHPNLHVLPEDNGERFFSAYLHAQIERKTTLTPHADNDCCQCEGCVDNPIEINGERVEVVEVPILNTDFDDLFGEDDCGFLEALSNG
jgi:hypothetical protein